MRHFAVVIALILLAMLTACSSSSTVAPKSAGTPAAGAAARATSGTLATVRSRGSVKVGVNDQLPGFGYLKPDGTFGGFDVDFGHALAAAIFGDANKADFTAVSASTRFQALAAGEIDVLIRNTTWSLSRDTSLHLTFSVPTFYDGQGVLVRVDDHITTLSQLNGAVVGALTGTTTQQNQEDTFAGTGTKYQPLTFDRNETLQAAFIAGRCDAWTSDKSQLAARRAAFPERQGGPQSLVILPETLSKEPLTPATHDSDSVWSDLVNWVVLGRQKEVLLFVGLTFWVVAFGLSQLSAQLERLLGVRRP